MSILSDASKAYARDRSREHYDELIVAMMLEVSRDAEILAPGKISYNQNNEMGVELGMVQASDQQWYYVVCSCQEEIDKLNGAVAVKVKLSELLRRVKTEENVGGLCLDPMNGANCFVSKEDACVLLDNLANNNTIDFHEN